MERSGTLSSYKIEGPREDVQATFERLAAEGATLNRQTPPMKTETEGEMSLVVDMESGATALQIQTLVGQWNSTVGVTDHVAETEDATMEDERV